ncbi:unnamed protein product, partial [Brenthis ino]
MLRFASRHQKSVSGILGKINCHGGVVASMYGCTPGGPGFESRVGPSLVIESFCIVSLSNSTELGSWRCPPPCLEDHVKTSVLRLNSHRWCRAVVRSMRVIGIESALVSARTLVHYNISCAVG